MVVAATCWACTTNSPGHVGYESRASTTAERMVSPVATGELVAQLGGEGELLGPTRKPQRRGPWTRQTKSSPRGTRCSRRMDAPSGSDTNWIASCSAQAMNWSICGSRPARATSKHSDASRNL